MQTVHIILGTKAQYIKMAPIILACRTKGMKVHLIDTGQHAATASELRQIFALPEPHQLVPGRKGDIARLAEGPRWLFGLACSLWQCRSQVFDNQPGLVLVHGDTASTLIGAVLGKVAGFPIVHIESGLRSWRWLHPFPEEIIRVLVMRMGKFLIAPSLQAQQNIRRMGLKKKCVFIRGNSIGDALKMTWQPIEERPMQVLACIHRMETLQRKSRLMSILDCLLRLQQEGWKVTFVQHPATERVIHDIGYHTRMSRAGVKLLPIQPYDAFLALMGAAEMVIADGGSIQEECALLGKWCLVPRHQTERSDGVGQCVHLVDCDWERWQKAINGRRRSRGANLSQDQPSMAIAAWLKATFLAEFG